MAPRFGLVASRLHTVAAPKQFEEVGSDEEEEDGHGGDGIARNCMGLTALMSRVRCSCGSSFINQTNTSD